MIALAGFLVMGVWQSTSFAAWTQINIPGTPQIASVAVADSFLFASTDSGIFRSSNNGTTWQKATGIQKFDKLRGNSTTLYAGSNYNGLYESADHGISWTRARSVDSIAEIVQDWDVHGTKIMINNLSRIYLSENSCQSWIVLNTFNSQPRGCSIVGKFLFSTGGYGLFRSENSGLTWQEVSYGLSTTIDPLNIKEHTESNRSTFFASSSSPVYPGNSSHRNIGFYSSKDSGTTWRSMGLKRMGFDFVLSKTTAFVGTDSGVYAAPIDSTTWTNISMSSFPRIFSLAIDTGFLYATIGDIFFSNPDATVMFRRPLSEVNALLKRKVSGLQPLASNNFFIDHFASQQALGITFNPGRAEKASLRVYSATGKAVATLFDGITQYGTNKFIWDYKTMPSGIYCISLQSENGKAVKKVQVMR
jgi:hypothetical protein